jgi:uroporphyrinogen decarboxylase
MTTPKELIDSALRREYVDRIPFCAPLQGFWALWRYGVTVRDSLSNPKMAADAQIKVIEEFHMDGAEALWDWLQPAEAMGCEVMVPDFGTIATVTHVIGEPGDLDRLKMPDLKNFRRFVASKESAAYIADHFKNDRFLIAPIPSAFTLSGELRGVEQMMMDCILEEDFVRELTKRSLDIVMPFLEDMIEWDIDSILIGDPTASGDLVSAEDYAKLSGPTTKKLGDAIRKGGMAQINHICGDTSDRLEHVADTGCNAFSVDKQVNIGDAVRDIGHRMAIIGNIDPAGTLFSGTPDKVRAEVTERMKSGGRRGFMLGAGCDIPIGSPNENIVAMSEAIRAYR